MSHYQQQPGVQNPYGYNAPPPQYYPPSMPPMGPSGPPEQALANQGARLGARILDTIFMIVPIVVMMLITMAIGRASGGATPVVALLNLLGFAAVLVFYEPFMTAKYGATFGKRICGLRVARLSDGQNLSFGAAFGRWAVYMLIGFIPLGGLINVLSCCWDKPYRQCFHDKAASSVVVNRTA
ncbi:RDD family protein [Streptomyces sp. NPDC046261]|uniref:RDD family protein n=1 Tax=Streptomyces sp. NPDC046261 TaxID=3157200 RepID=UPI003408579F